MKVYISCDEKSRPSIEKLEQEIAPFLTEDIEGSDVILIVVDNNYDFNSNEYKTQIKDIVKPSIVILDSNKNRQFIPKDLNYELVCNIRSLRKFNELVDLLSKDEWTKVEPSKRRKNIVKHEKRKQTSINSIKQMEKEQKKLLEQTKLEQERLLELARQEKEKWLGLNKLDQDTSIKHTSDSDEVEGCIVCFGDIKNSAFDPCGHNSCCYDCAQGFINKSCPMCRQPVGRILKLFS